MKWSKWNKEIEKLSDAKLRSFSGAMQTLLSWDTFKREFAGVRTLESIVSIERAHRHNKRQELLGKSR